MKGREAGHSSAQVPVRKVKTAMQREEVNEAGSVLVAYRMFPPVGPTPLRARSQPAPPPPLLVPRVLLRQPGQHLGWAAAAEVGELGLVLLDVEQDVDGVMRSRASLVVWPEVISSLFDHL